MKSNTSLTVSSEPTPNPATMKFRVSKAISDTSLDCTNSLEAEQSPLASKLFGFPWTSRVYIGNDFVTVTKQDWVDWDVLAEPLSNLIQEHIESGLPIHAELKEFAEGDVNAELETDSDVVKQIKRVLNREIRPAVAIDGGDILFAKYESNILYLHMRGSCNGCPSSSATLKQGIEVRMKEVLPEIKEVVAI